ncbi:MAG TPA: two-component regulator propeller domain-containing protein [Pyrinomonadaceae bacterium]|nr:two-component regulator propeller domain-containing protein [Pyrinomonadaceae bacterium]
MAHRLDQVLNAAVVRWWNSFGAVCLWCLLVGFGSVPASLAQYRFDPWTADDGLPQNIIRAIHQTRDGYLWFSTSDRLVRFDGVRFTVFNKSNSPGIKSNRFNSLYEDREGVLWVGTDRREGLA